LVPPHVAIKVGTAGDLTTWIKQLHVTGLCWNS
jgi:hypothetical protein